MDINVLDFGAVGDGVTLDTAAIQAAIDACAGGRVVFPGGHVFRSGRLTLHSDMELRFEAGPSSGEATTSRTTWPPERTTAKKAVTCPPMKTASTTARRSGFSSTPATAAT